MNDMLVLYSTNTWLAYAIAQRFYNGQHYVWCTNYFDPEKANSRDVAVPPTSSTFEIYRGLHKEVSRGDLHSQRIQANRIGILRGANVKRQANIIGEQQEKDIASIVTLAQPREFRPLMYIIPYLGIADKLREPPVEDKAHPLSAEYIIDNLPRECFDIIEFGEL